MRKKFIAFFFTTIAVMALGLMSCQDPNSNVFVVVDKVFLNQSVLTLNVGDEFVLTAIVLPENATEQSVKWTSSDRDVAEVSGGKITAKKVGTATITATAGGKSATCTVTVKPTVVTLTFNANGGKWGGNNTLCCVEAGYWLARHKCHD